MIKMDKLLFWLSKRYNVLLEGKHGIGKTAVILEAFKKAGLNYAYFSGSTMDPYIDFCGVPIKIDENGQSHIELIRPQNIHRGIQAIFIDEYNRTHKKIRNATMELIQFGTINGVKIFDDLQVVWAAINPDSDEDISVYDTDRLDPAQKDRFHVHVSLPYKCDYDYFSSVYGANVAKSAIQWWDDLPTLEKDKVSPRRLDYTLKIWKDGGDIRDALPQTSSPHKLVNILAIGPAEAKLETLIGKTEEAKKFFANENNYNYALKSLIANSKFLKEFTALLPNEKIVILYQTESKVKQFILEDVKEKKADSPFSSILVEVTQANHNNALATQIKSELTKLGVNIQVKEVPVFHYDNIITDDKVLESIEAEVTQAFSKPTAISVDEKYNIYKKLESNIGIDLSIENSKKIINILNYLCFSQHKTIKENMPNLVAISNHAIKNMMDKGVTVNELTSIISNKKKLKRCRAMFNAPSLADITLICKKQTLSVPGKTLEWN